jgi:hypothetical protein
LHYVSIIKIISEFQQNQYIARLQYKLVFYRGRWFSTGTTPVPFTNESGFKYPNTNPVFYS